MPVSPVAQEPSVVARQAPNDSDEWYAPSESASCGDAEYRYMPSHQSALNADTSVAGRLARDSAEM